jgi:hypothetical protein
MSKRTKPNPIQRQINQMYGKLRSKGALLLSKKDANGTIEEYWALLEHRYQVIKDKGRMPHIFHSYTTGATFCSE